MKFHNQQLTKFNHRLEKVSKVANKGRENSSKAENVTETD